MIEDHNNFVFVKFAYLLITSLVYSFDYDLHRDISQIISLTVKFAWYANQAVGSCHYF